MKSINTSDQAGSTQEGARANDSFFKKNGSGDFFAEPKVGAAPFFQTKLTIGQPNDKYEQEADAVADAVINKKEEQPTVQAKKITPVPTSDFTQKKCEACEEEETIQRKADGDEMTASTHLQSQLNATKGSGRPLPEGTRSSMESAIGADFSGVRVHTGGAAVQMSQDLGAQAFTHGSDVYFNEGKYNANSNSGKHLLAHELTHVVQQGGGKKPIRRKLQEIDFKALAEQVHTALHKFHKDEFAVYTALQKLGKDQVKIDKLIEQYRLLFNRELDIDISRKLGKAKAHISLELINQSPPGKTVLSKDPGSVIPQKDIQKLHTALNEKNKNAIYALFLGYSNYNLLRLEAAYNKTYQPAGHGSSSYLIDRIEQQIKNKKDAAYAIYLLNKVGESTPNPPYESVVSVQGTEAVIKGGKKNKNKRNASFGQVSVRTGADFDGQKDGFSLGYQGALSGYHHWLQFADREVIVYGLGGQTGIGHLTGKKDPEHADIKYHNKGSKSGGMIPTTTDPKNPNYHVDSSNSTTPYYDVGASRVRAWDSITMLDSPGTSAKISNYFLGHGASKVVEKGHYIAYLVRDYQPLYEVRISIQWEMTKKMKSRGQAMTKTVLVDSTKPVKKLPKKLREVLHKAYPAYKFIR